MFAPHGLHGQQARPGGALSVTRLGRPLAACGAPRVPDARHQAGEAGWIFRPARARYVMMHNTGG